MKWGSWRGNEVETQEDSEEGGRTYDTWPPTEYEQKKGTWI